MKAENPEKYEKRVSSCKEKAIARQKELSAQNKHIKALMRMSV